MQSLSVGEIRTLFLSRSSAAFGGPASPDPMTSRSASIRPASVTGPARGCGPARVRSVSLLHQISNRAFPACLSVEQFPALELGLSLQRFPPSASLSKLHPFDCGLGRINVEPELPLDADLVSRGFWLGSGHDR